MGSSYTVVPDVGGIARANLDRDVVTASVGILGVVLGAVRVPRVVGALSVTAAELSAEVLLLSLLVGTEATVLLLFELSSDKSVERSLCLRKVDALSGVNPLPACCVASRCSTGVRSL